MNLRDHQRQLLVLTPVVVMAVWAMYLVTTSTSDTLRTQPDSAVYLGTAAEIRDGHGPTIPFTYTWDRYSPSKALDFDGHVPSPHFPPLYATAIALVSLVTGGLRSAARLLDVLAIGANLVLVGWLTARMTSFRSILVPAIPPALLLLTPDTRPFQFEGYGWVLVHQTIAAEPLFIGFFVAGIIAIGAAVRSENLRTLVVAGAVTAGALATRYVGIALVFAGAIAFVAFDARPDIRARLRRAALFVAIPLVPTVLFFTWSLMSGGGGARVVDWHQVGGTRRTIEWFGRYLFPTDWPAWVRTLGLVVVVVLVVAGAIWAHFGDERAQATVRVALLGVVSYASVLVVTRTLFDRNVPIDPRLLLPARAVFYAAVVAVAYTALAPKLRPVGASIVIALAFVPLTIAGWDDQQVWLDTAAIAAPERNAVEAALADLPDDAFVMSSAPDVAYLKAGGRSTYMLPARVVYLTGDPNTRFDAEVDEWARVLQERGGYVHYGPTIDPVVTVEELSARVPLRLVVQDGEDGLYEVPRR